MPREDQDSGIAQAEAQEAREALLNKLFPPDAIANLQKEYDAYRSGVMEVLIVANEAGWQLFPREDGRQGEGLVLKFLTAQRNTIWIRFEPFKSWAP